MRSQYDILWNGIGARAEGESPSACARRTASGDPLPVRSGSGQDAGGHSGVHGCEYVGVQALRRLAVELDPAELSGNVILLPLANPTGFYAGAKQVVPEGRSQPEPGLPRRSGGHPVGPAGLRAGNCPLPGGRLLADLHSGDCNEALYPLVFFPTAGTEAVNRAALTAARALTVPYRVRSTAQNGLYSWAVQKNIPALLIERGGLGLWSETEVNACCEDVRALLRHLDILPGGNPFRDQVEIAEARYVESAADGLWHPAAGLNDSVKAGGSAGEAGGPVRPVYPRGAGGV